MIIPSIAVSACRLSKCADASSTTSYQACYYPHRLLPRMKVGVGRTLFRSRIIFVEADGGAASADQTWCISIDQPAQCIADYCRLTAVHRLYYHCIHHIGIGIGSEILLIGS
jgi:hypothetical protein